MIDEAQDAATRFKFSGTKGLPCTAASFMQLPLALRKGRPWAADICNVIGMPKDATLDCMHALPRSWCDPHTFFRAAMQKALHALKTTHETADWSKGVDRF